MILHILFSLIWPFLGPAAPSTACVSLQATTSGCITQSPIEDSTRTARKVIAPGTFISSSDGGATWNDLSTHLNGNVQPISLGSDNTTCYVGAVDGLYSMKSAGCISDLHKEDIAGEGISVFTGQNDLYANSFNGDLYRYHSAKKSWKPMQGVAETKVYTVLESSKGMLFTGGENGVYRSEDQGLTWKHVFDKTYVAKMLESGEALIIQANNNALWRSVDSGETWTPTLGNAYRTFEVRTLPQGLVALTSRPQFPGIEQPNDVYLSKDNGGSWEKMHLTIPASLTDVYDLQTSGDLLFACSKAGVMRSADQGATWECVVPAHEQPNGFYRLSVSGNTIYALWMNGC